jgi:hypothetical protein
LQDLASTQATTADQLQQRLFSHYRSIGHDLNAQRWLPGNNPVYDFAR